MEKKLAFCNHDALHLNPVITNKDNLTKENARIKQVLMDSGYHQSNASKIFQRITNNHNLSQSQQQTQATDIKKDIEMNRNLLFDESTIENYSVFSDLTK